MVVSVINQPNHDSSLFSEVDAVDIQSNQLLICSTEMKSDLVSNDLDSHTNDPIILLLMHPLILILVPMILGVKIMK